MEDKKKTKVQLFKDLTGQNKKKKQKKEIGTSLDNYFQNIIDSSINMIVTVDKDRNIVEFNPAACETFGYAKKEVLGKQIGILYADQDAGREIAVQISKKGKFTGEIQNIRKNGEIFTCFLSAAVIINDKGESIGTIGSSIDISKNKNNEQALIESEGWYRTLVERASDGIIIIQDEKIRFINHKITEMYGYTFEELAGTSLLDYIQPDERSKTLANYKNKLSGVKNRELLKVSVMHKDGSKKEVEINSGLITYKGNPAILTYLRDITEQRQHEIERSKASKLESIGLLAGGIAHDFNNILAVILGNASLAKMIIDNKNEVIELLTEIENASLRAKGLTQQLLTFSKGGTPTVKTTELFVLIHDIIQFSLHGSNVQYSIHIIPDLWFVKVDQKQIRQAIGNLIINAQQSMPDGGTINVKADNIIVNSKDNLPLNDGNYVKISIEDKGHGISEEHLTKVFDPYFTTKKEGSGLGLATTYSVIKQHEGHIEIESEVGVGTIFHIYLPAVLAQTQKSQAVNGHRILVMDDDELVRKYIVKVIEVFGHTALIGINGEETLKIYKKAMNTDKPIDTVIMDLTIPGGMGGKEAIKKLLKIDPKAKAIVSSGYSNDPVISDYKAYGFKGFILKPFVPNDLNKVINDVLS